MKRDEAWIQAAKNKEFYTNLTVERASNLIESLDRVLLLSADNEVKATLKLIASVIPIGELARELSITISKLCDISVALDFEYAETASGVDIKRIKIGRGYSSTLDSVTTAGTVAPTGTVANSGEFKCYESATGGKRSVEDGKIDYTYIDKTLLDRVCKHMEKNARHYGRDNWKNLTTMDDYMRYKRSLLRHTIQFVNGSDLDEDHLAAIVFNAQGLIYLQDRTIVNVPEYQKV